LSHNHKLQRFSEGCILARYEAAWHVTGYFLQHVTKRAQHTAAACFLFSADSICNYTHFTDFSCYNIFHVSYVSNLAPVTRLIFVLCE